MSDFTEIWRVVVRGNEYTLNADQAKFLQGEITKGSRGIIVFSDFSISIPYIEEFFLLDRKPVEQEALPDPNFKQPNDRVYKAVWQVKPTDFTNPVGERDGTGHHIKDKNEHTIFNYTKVLSSKEGVGEIILRWGDCQNCGGCYHKTIYGISIDGTCYTRELVKAGESMFHNQKPS